MDVSSAGIGRWAAWMKLGLLGKLTIKPSKAAIETTPLQLENHPPNSTSPKAGGFLLEPPPNGPSGGQNLWHIDNAHKGGATSV